MAEIFAASRVITADAVLSPGWVGCDDAGRIIAFGEGAPAVSGDAGADRVRDFGDATLAPGFVDLHCHGGGGGGYTDGVASARIARAAHLAHGTTTTMASLVTDTPERLIEQVRALVPLVETGELGGIHLEGPWLSPLRKGAHAEEMLREPSIDEAEALLAAGTCGDGRQAIRMVTIAPELPGSLAAIGRFVSAGVLAAVGHTDADTRTTELAIAAGATVATHLFNAMRPLHHREPGPVLPLMREPGVVVELVADGTHLHPELPLGVEEAVGPMRAVYVTDAMSAAAHVDGDYTLGGLAVEVRDGVARLAGADTIAGSTATMDRLFRGRVLAGARDASIRDRGSGTDDALLAAARLTATNPARVAAWDWAGEIAVGKRADLVVLDPDLEVAGVILAGREVRK